MLNNAFPLTYLSPILAHELHLKQRGEWQLAVRRDGGGASHRGETQLASRTRTDHRFLGARRLGLKQRLLLRRVGRTVPRVPEEDIRALRSWKEGSDRKMIAFVLKILSTSYYS